MEKQIISIEVEDKPGVLARIATLFSRRGYNIESLTVANTHQPDISHFTIVSTGDEAILEQIRKQCQKLVHVIKVDQIDPEKSVLREFSILKLKLTKDNAKEIWHIIDFHGLRLMHSADDFVIVEISGSEEKVNAMKQMIKPENVLAFIRTGKMALSF